MSAQLIKRFLICVLFVSVDLYAVELKEFGVVDRVDLAGSALVIDDQYYTMALNMRVFDRRGDEVNRHYLKKGQKLNFMLKGGGSEVQQLDQIWVLPDNASRPSEEDD